MDLRGIVVELHPCCYPIARITIWSCRFVRFLIITKHMPQRPRAGLVFANAVQGCPFMCWDARHISGRRRVTKLDRFWSPVDCQPICTTTFPWRFPIPRVLEIARWIKFLVAGVSMTALEAKVGPAAPHCWDSAKVRGLC